MTENVEKKNASGPVSRVLSLDDHLSRTCVAARLKHATRTYGGPPCRVPICACSGWGFPSHAVADALVRYCGMTEAQAHHALEQRAMDARISLRDAALAVLNTYGEA